MGRTPKNSVGLVPPSSDSKPALEARLRKLPRWAIVAFAARCARRAQPAFTLDWPDAPPTHIQAIETAISVAEQSSLAGRPAARGGYAFTSEILTFLAVAFGFLAGVVAVVALCMLAFLVTALFSEFAAHDAFHIIVHAVFTALVVGAVIAVAILAYFCANSARGARATYASLAANAAYSAAFSARASDARAGDAAAKAAGRAAASAASRTDYTADAASASLAAQVALATYYAPDAAIHAAKTDLELLEGLAERERWTDKTWVPWSVFGDLWPNGPPERIHET